MKQFLSSFAHRSFRPLSAFGLLLDFLAAVVLLVSGSAWAGGVVTQPTEAAFLAAMSGGGTVTFACDATLTLQSDLTNALDTVVDANGHSVTFDGGGRFYVCNHTRLTLIGMSIINHFGRQQGAAVFIDGGVLNLESMFFRSNTARGFESETGPPVEASGGAIFNQGGSLNATNTTFVGNSVVHAWNYDSNWQWKTHGGAICNQTGTVCLLHCVFSANTALGGPGVTMAGSLPSNLGGEAQGGALFNNGAMSADFCTFLSNQSGGGAGGSNFYDNVTYPNNGRPGGRGGGGYGGAVCNFGTLNISRSLFASNSASGGDGSAGGRGAGGMFATFGGWGGDGGPGSGGALYNNGTTRLDNCTLAVNSAQGGNGGAGGAGGFSDFSIGGNGGPGGNGGNAFGAVSDATGTLSLTNCSIVFNTAVGGLGAQGGSGGWGQHGSGYPGSNGGNGAAAGFWTTGASLVNTLLAADNSAVNTSGRLADAGHNLSSDASCAFTNSASLNSTDPKLGFLADNGGPTWTVCLRPGSPAIDAADTGCAPSTDQRGFPRPSGVAADIGAFEVMPWLRISPAAPSGIELLASGLTGPSCRLLTSSDLFNWAPAVTNQVSADGTTAFHDDCTNAPLLFYRVAAP